MTALLMLDASGQKWVRPELPTQRCGVDGVAWNLKPDDLAGRPPEVLIGGSYQVAASCTFDEVVSRLPAMDGLHIVNAFAGEARRLFTFISISGEPRLAEMDTVVVDDWAAVLDAHADRLQLI